MSLHPDQAAGRWRTMPLVEQMANIGSEVHRAIAWRAKGRDDVAGRALDRCLDLFDLTIADPRWRMRLKEICRAREVVCDFLYGDNEYGSTAESLERYFLAYAYAARQGR